MEKKKVIEPLSIVLELVELIVLVSVGYLFYKWGGLRGITSKQLIVLVSILILFLVTGSAWFYRVSEQNLSEEFKKVFKRTLVIMLILSIVIIILSVFYIMVIK